MSINYNEFGEVISVNGITTGHHIGTPMQDAAAEKPEDNQAYGEELSTVTRVENVVEDEQPKPQGGGASSWNDLKDKPFNSEELFPPIVIPRDLDLSIHFDLGKYFDMEKCEFYKLNCEVVSMNDWFGATVYIKTINFTTEHALQEVITKDGMPGIHAFEFFKYVKEDDTSDMKMYGFIFLIVSVSDYGIPIGCYIARTGGYEFSSFPNIAQELLTITFVKEAVTPLPEKYMPLLTSPNGTKFKIQVSDDGTISATEVTE